MARRATPRRCVGGAARTPNHPLVDGGKRRAWLATYVFCARNGVELDPGDDAACDLAVAVAGGSLEDVEDIAQRLAAFA